MIFPVHPILVLVNANKKIMTINIISLIHLIVSTYLMYFFPY